MRGLKVLVVVMGALLVGGTAVLVAAIIERARHRLVEPSAVHWTGGGFDRTVIDLPAGAHVIATGSAGDRLVVRVGLADGGEALILIDPRNGERVGTVELRPGAAKP
jgi:hypothetical protein